MKRFNYILFCLTITFYSTLSFAQLDSVYYQGPAGGSVASGVMVTLDSATIQPVSGINPKVRERNIIEPDFGMMKIDNSRSPLPPYVYTEDTNASENPEVGGGQPVLINKFESIPMTNSIPPDPHVAVGPNHIIACVNTSFAVYNKQGVQLAILGADTWINPVITAGAFDPQVMYDHYAQRWFMLWDWQDDATQQAYFIISYSENSNPFGTWYMYLMDAKVNGTANSGTWGDYPQIGYDENAIFINSRSFTFGGGSYLYNRLRILNKAELYASNGGSVTWKDIWNIHTPGLGSGGQALDVIHPVYSYTPGSGSFFMWANRNGANFYCIYQMLNPLSATPRLRGKVIATQTYGATPNANQLGGGSPLIETNGSHMKTQPVLRDGKIYFAHSIANTTNATYASAKYGIYDIGTESITEQAEQGAIGYYYIYPTIAVDQNLNIAVTYSRSATTEYIGAYYSSKLAADPPGLRPSQPIEVGHGNYVVDFGSGRNRWGDYLGICVDPDDFNSIFMLSEFAKNTNQWGTYIAEIRMIPFPGIHTFISSSSLGFGNVEINTISDTMEVVISNYGTDDLIISDISSAVGPFSRISNHTFPLTLQSYDSVTVQVVFSPITPDDYDEVLSFTTNDPNLTGIQLSGHSYEIIEPYTDIFYASSGGGNNGDMITIDRTTGVGTTLGPSLYGEIRSLTVDPINNVLYGLVSGGNSKIVRVNADAGDAYTLFTLDLVSLTGIDFDSGGNLYLSAQTGEIYSVDLNTGDYTYVTTASHKLNAIAFDPNTDVLWGALWKSFGAGKDSVYTIDITTGVATPIGVTGFGIMTNDMAFDENDKLYGVTGTSNQEGKIFEINQSDGSGTLIGTGIGFNHTDGIAFSINGPILSADNQTSTIPVDYSLKQNYPNPFNPSTKIEFALPIQSDVQLTIYNLLGQKVSSLYDGQLQAGSHSFTWNANDLTGKKVSSGIYFYELKAKGSDGSNFQNTRKMLLLK
jgi:FlgD Ig-like domain